MDILLINSRVKDLHFHAGMTPPLGLAYIGAVLLEAGYTVSALDLNVTVFCDEQLRQYLTEYHPRMIGISAYTETYKNAVRFARLAKETIPDVKISVGGPHVSVMVEEAAREGVFDTVSIGEGEITNLRLAAHFIKGEGRLEDIAGIAYVHDGQLVVTAPRPPVEDVDTLPFPARDLFPLERYLLPVAILTSRGGCPFACNFCAVNNIWHGQRRFRSPEKVMEEIDFVLERYPNHTLNFSDDSFTLSKKRILSLCDMIVKKYGPMVLQWQCATRIDLVDEELMRAMRRAGCNTIQFGIEAGSQKILDSIGKKIRLEQVKDSIALAFKYGMNVLCSFMFPHPEDTEETIEAQIRLMKDLQDQGAEISLALTTPYPGTLFYEKREELGLTLLSQDWEDYDCMHLVISTKQFDKEALKCQLNKMVRSLGMQSFQEAGI